MNVVAVPSELGVIEFTGILPGERDSLKTRGLSAIAAPFAQRKLSIRKVPSPDF